MPFINSVGSVCHGVGGGHFNLNNVAKFIGAAGGWLDDGRAACTSGESGDILPPDGWPAMIYTVATNTRAAASTPPKGANLVFAGGGHMAWWLAGSGGGLFSTTGLRLPAAGLLGMGPDGAIGYKPNYHANGPTRVREVGGGDYLVTNNHAYTLQLLGGRRAIWLDSVNGLQVLGIPTPAVYPGQVGFPYAFLIGGAWWIGYWNITHGVLMHPFAAPDLAHVLVAAGTDAWPAWRAMSNNSVRFAWSSSEAEQAGQITISTITISGVPDGPVEPLPPTTGPVPPDTVPPTTTTEPRARVVPRQPLSRQYPHVDGITDWRAQQTARLLWDRVFDLEERLHASEQTAGDLVPISNSQDDHLASLQAIAGEALSMAQFTQGQLAAAGGGLPPGTPGWSPSMPIIAMSADPAAIAASVHASYVWYVANLGSALATEPYWVDKAGHPDVFSDHKWYLGWNKYWEDRMHPANTGTADPAGGSLPSVHQ
jgi:hypothetical protein